MSRKPSKPETRIEDYLDVMTGGNATLTQPILRIEFYYAFLAGMAVELPQPILDDEKLLARICGMEVEAPTYIPGISPRLYAYMAKKGGQDVQVPDPILRLERYWYDYSAGETPSVQEYTGAVPVTFIADGTPLLDLLISGNEEHSGTPTPDNPIMPQGTGERTGNLFDLNSVTTNERGETRVGVELPAGAYCITNLSNAACYWRIGVETQNGNQIIPSAPYVYINAPDTLVVWVGANSNKSIMLNTGSTALPYEPYGYKIPISSADTTTPIYFGEVETTRQVRKLVLENANNWLSASGGFYTATVTPDYMRSQGEIYAICSHFPISPQTNSITNVPNGYMSFMYAENAKRIYVKDSRFENLNAFKQYISAQYAAGTPVTVWYVLATPETAVVNEPLMKIGDYADTLSMEQAGVPIFTANGSTTLDVEATVPPSEIYIKYHGEAVATLSALPAEVSSPEETTEEVNPEETEEEENER